MIITEPNGFVAEVHDRMPVRCSLKRTMSLGCKAGLELLKPAAENVLQRWPVSRPKPLPDQMCEKNSGHYLLTSGSSVWSSERDKPISLSEVVTIADHGYQ